MKTSTIVNVGIGGGMALMVLGGVAGEAESGLIWIGALLTVASFIAAIIKTKYEEE